MAKLLVFSSSLVNNQVKIWKIKHEIKSEYSYSVFISVSIWISIGKPTKQSNDQKIKNDSTASFDTRVNETVAVYSSQIELNLTDNNLVEMNNMLNGCLHSKTLVSQTGPMTMPSIYKTRPVTTSPIIFSTTVVTMNSATKRQRFPGTSSL